MASFGESFTRELGKDTGKWVSNKIFGDAWSTPHRVILQREREGRKVERQEAQYYKEQMLSQKRESRDLEREQKQRERDEAQQNKEQVIANNTKEVNEHNNYITIIQSVHKDYSNPIDWDEILKQEPPKEVSTGEELRNYYREYTDKQVNEKIAAAKSNAKMSLAKNIIGKYYTPKYAWIFKIGSFKALPFVLYFIAVGLAVETKNYTLGVITGVILVIAFILLKLGSKDFQKGVDLENEIAALEANREKWFEEYIEEQNQAHSKYLQEIKEYKEMIDIATGVKSKDKQSFIYALHFFDPFKDLKNYGSDVSYTADSDKINVDLYVHSEDVIPHTTKRILRKGLEVKEEWIPATRFNEIYQDYVCSSILRISKEVFALLPLEKVLINAQGSLLNTATGIQENKTIVSVLIERNKLDMLNFDLLDPSDSMSNFACNMSFKKTEGFYPVNSLSAF